MLVNILIKNELGEFVTPDMDISELEYTNLVNFSKDFYKNGFDMETTEGHIIIPPDIIKKSIMLITNKTTSEK